MAESSTAARRYCEDCQHCFVPPSGLAYARCQKAADNNGEIYVSRDFASKEWLYAATARRDVAKCGPGAKMFEAKSAIQQAAE